MSKILRKIVVIFVVIAHGSLIIMADFSNSNVNVDSVYNSRELSDDQDGNASLVTNFSFVANLIVYMHPVVSNTKFSP